MNEAEFRVDSKKPQDVPPSAMIRKIICINSVLVVLLAASLPALSDWAQPGKTDASIGPIPWPLKCWPPSGNFLMGCWQPQNGFPVRTGGSIPGYVYIVLISAFLSGTWRVLEAIWTFGEARREPEPAVRAPFLQLTAWACLMLGAFAAFLSGHGLIRKPC